jgi:arylsulfatase A-like enzyme
VSRPNLLIVMPDQLRADCVGCFGNPRILTPHIDALAQRGTRFTAAYANHPVCGPSRVSLMTGWYPHTRGHRTLTHLLKPWEPNLLRYLKDGGYHVAIAGSRGDMFAPGVTEVSTHFCGWTERPKRMSMGPQFAEDHPLYAAFYHGRRGEGTWLDFDEAAVRTALDWFAGKPKGPWVLFVPLIFPHLPFEVEEPFYSRHQAADMPLPRPIAPGKPQFHAALRAVNGSDRLTPADWREITRTYYGMIARVDEQLGRLLAAVDTLGATNDTSVWFFTDHGEYLGDFGLVEKWPSGLDDCLLRNPLIATLPGQCSGATHGGFVEMVDIMATLLELAEIEPSHTHFGRSLVPALKDSACAVRDAATSEGGFRSGDVHLFEQPTGEYRRKGELQHAQPTLVGKAIVRREADWTYVHRLYESDELYDRRKDPGEVHNLIDSPAAAGVLPGLRQRLLDWLHETSDVIPWDADPRFPKTANGQHTIFAP